MDEIGERLAALRLERDGLVRQLEAPFEAIDAKRMRFGPNATLAVRVEGAFELRLDFRGAGSGARVASTMW